MKTYRLYVSMPSSKFGTDVIADEVTMKNLRIDFYKKNSNQYLPRILVASYPSQYTIIESIKENK
jgi:hypothetical protein